MAGAATMPFAFMEESQERDSWWLIEAEHDQYIIHSRCSTISHMSALELEAEPLTHNFI